MARSAAEGACDGSMLGANLEVNPGLTIAALAEHAMSHLPPAAEQSWPQGPPPGA